ncbi:MAG: translation initiation factor IF-2 N-terminal domain-containing protein, partial [Planctomycetota bacterium]|nr:translation initiation factor IF-2 N-terminal domain-containing protein [Planctomycetota bacterium]
MAVRIYSLAKELKLDSKELVELCTRAGIQDKGSALASLDDAEVARIKEFVAGKTKSPERAKATTDSAAAPKAPAVMKREDYVAPTGAARQGRPKELGSKAPAPKPAPLGKTSKPASEQTGTGDQGDQGSPPIQVRPG